MRNVGDREMSETQENWKKLSDVIKAMQGAKGNE